MLIHASLAKAMPRFAINEPDAKQLAVAWCNWRRHYGTIIDPRTRDLMAFLGVAAMVEGPRITATLADRNAAKAAAAVAKAAAESSGGTVVDINQYSPR